MSAKVYSTSRYAIIEDDTATGLKLANLTYASSVSETMGEDHLGQEDSLALYNDKTEVSGDGVVAVSATGMDMALADVIALANDTDGSHDLPADKLFTVADANAGTIITSLDLTRGNKAFETGSFNGTFRPLLATNAPTTLT
jgi:hypothetical protein